MSRPPNQFNNFNSYFPPQDGFGQGAPRSLTDPNWNIGPMQPPLVAQPPYPPQGPPLPAFGYGPSQPQVNTSFRPRSASFRPPRPRGASSSTNQIPRSSSDWMIKLDKDAPSTLIDFRQATEEGGTKFSEKVGERMSNAKVVGGLILNDICKAATRSVLENTNIGLEGNLDASKEPSIAEQIKAIEDLENDVKRIQK